MSYARDRLYNGYLRRNMPTIVSKVKVREIIPHLPCLTDHDRENIEAKRETYGNYDGMMLLLDCLKRRESWPEQFIQALEACEHQTIAAEIRAEYDTLRGASNESANSNPSSPSTTVVRAHVHPAPSASHPPVPESGGNSQAAVAPPAEASAPPEPAAQPSPSLQIPVQPEPPQNPAAQVPKDAPPPEPVAEPPKAAQIKVPPPPSTPPPSPATPHTQETATPPPHHHQEPEENSESDIQDIGGNNAVSPKQVSTGNGVKSLDSTEAPQPSSPVEQSETETPSSEDTPTTVTEVRPPRSPSPAENDSDLTDGASVIVTTPEKAPVQDTTPPTAALEPEETSEPPTEQAIESSPRKEAAATDSPLPPPPPPPATAAAAADDDDDDDEDDGTDALPTEDNSVCLSKPGELISVQPQNHDSPTIPASSSHVEPYSGDSGRIEMSNSAPETEIPVHTPACSAVSSTPVKSVTALPCQENGIDNIHNEPEENHYESPSQSLDTQEVLEHVGHVSGEPSILDLAVQNSTPQAQIVNGEAAKEMKSASLVSSDPSDTVSPSHENSNPSEPAAEETSPQLQTLQDSQQRKASRILSANPKYIVAAVGVGACAALMAWKYKN